MINQTENLLPTSRDSDQTPQASAISYYLEYAYEQLTWNNAGKVLGGIGAIQPAVNSYIFMSTVMEMPTFAIFVGLSSWGVNTLLNSNFTDQTKDAFQKSSSGFVKTCTAINTLTYTLIAIELNLVIGDALKNLLGPELAIAILAINIIYAVLSRFATGYNAAERLERWLLSGPEHSHMKHLYTTRERLRQLRNYITPEKYQELAAITDDTQFYSEVLEELKEHDPKLNDNSSSRLLLKILFAVTACLVGLVYFHLVSSCVDRTVGLFNWMFHADTELGYYAHWAISFILTLPNVIFFYVMTQGLMNLPTNINSVFTSAYESNICKKYSGIAMLVASAFLAGFSLSSAGDAAKSNPLLTGSVVKGVLPWLFIPAFLAAFFPNLSSNKAMAERNLHKDHGVIKRLNAIEQNEQKRLRKQESQTHQETITTVHTPLLESELDNSSSQEAGTADSGSNYIEEGATQQAPASIVDAAKSYYENLKSVKYAPSFWQNGCERAGELIKQYTPFCANL